jgi:hypothetical protein
VTVNGFLDLLPLFWPQGVRRMKKEMEILKKIIHADWFLLIRPTVICTFFNVSVNIVSRLILG